MRNYLKYKDYLGTVELSTEDELFYGKVHGINDLLSFEGQSVSELQIAFQEAVDEYLKTCNDLGKNPDKTYKGSFNIRLGKELHRKAAMLAIKRSVTLNDLVKNAIAEVVKTAKGS